MDRSANPMGSYIAVATAKGQVVIPADLRRKYGIGVGTRIRVVDAGDGIELRPLTDAARTVNLGDYAAQVRRLLAKAHYGSGYPSDVPDQLEPVVEAARAMVADRNGANAIAVLRLVCEPVVANYEEFEGDCEVAEFLEYDVVPLLTEAIELGDIGPQERQVLAGVLTAWDEQFEEYVGITPFEKPRQALRAGPSPGGRPGRP